jgi:dTMP kinase
VTVAGFFLVIDGIDGSGKSTQATRLAKAIAERGRETLHVREPGGTPFGEGLRRVLLDHQRSRVVAAEILTFFAARAQLLAEKIEPALARGAVVVCERWVSSTHAYQAAASGSHLSLVADLERTVVTRQPDLLLVLDLAPADAMARLHRKLDAIEGRGLLYLERVRAGFLEYAKRSPRAEVVNANIPPDELAALLLAKVTRALG